MVVGVSSSNGRVPSALPPILKKYTKAAIRTQPRDLISWSNAYFQSLLEGVSPPVKEQIEFPLPSTESGVSPGLLRVLHKKLGSLETVSRAEFSDLCQAMGVEESVATAAWESAGNGDEKNWDKLLASLISQEADSPQDQLAMIMKSVSDDAITKEVPLNVVFKYLTLLPCAEDSKLLEETKDFLADVASFQGEKLIPSDLFRITCPLNQ